MHILILWLLLLTISPSLSFASDSCSSTVKPHAAYINGVWNDKASADKNRKNIETFLKNQNLRIRFNKVVLAFNDTHGPSQDLYDVLAQKEQESPSVWGKVVNVLARLVTIGPAVLIDTAVQSDSTLGSVVTALADKIFDGIALKDYVDSDFVQVAADIAALSEGGNMLLIPHSQGSLYANRVYQQYAGTGRSVSIAAIANPASSMPVGQYVSSTNDAVLNWLRKTHNVLPANAPIEKHPDGSMGHTLALDYLGMPAGQAAIAAIIRNQLGSVPEIVIGGLPITLSWSDNSPLTLWVGDGGELRSAPGIGGTATYTVCNPQTFTFYFAWASSLGGWPTAATLSAGDRSAVVNLAASNEFNLWGDDIFRRMAGSVYVDQTGKVIGVQ